MLALIANGGLWWAAAAEPNAENPLVAEERVCQSKIDQLHTQIDHITLWSNVFMVAGALSAAIGSAFAGFLGSNGQRKAAALLGAVGAVLTVLPKALPDKNDLQSKLSAADKHHTIGLKFRNQLPFAQSTETLTEAQKYAAARFTDCAAYDPPDRVPEFPKTDPSQFRTTDLNRIGPPR